MIKKIKNKDPPPPSQQFLPRGKVRAEWAYSFSASQDVAHFCFTPPRSLRGSAWPNSLEGARSPANGQELRSTTAQISKTINRCYYTKRPTHEPQVMPHLQPPPVGQCTPAAFQHVPATRHASLHRQCTHTPPDGTHKSPWTAHRYWLPAQLCRTERKNITLNTSGHCPGENKWEALSTHPDFAGLREGKKKKS